MFARRLLILVAVLLGVAALASGVAPAPREPPATSESPSPAPDQASLIEREIDASAPGEPVRIAVPRGRTLVLTVRVSGPDAVTLGDMDVEPADAGSPAVLELVADDGARELPVRLVEADREIGRIVIG
jgi:hypothetical protein